MLALLFLTLTQPLVQSDSRVSTTYQLWAEPKPTTVSDWIWGPGGKQRAPLPPFRFVRENLGGTNPKIEVRDARGALWIVKFGGEVHTETFAARLLNAMGYVAEPTYYMADGSVTGIHGLKRAKGFVSKDGAFHDARFKLRDEKDLAYADDLHWSWNDNPFIGSRQLSGLKVLIMLVSNWDTKDARDGEGSNTAVFTRPASDPHRYFYSFTDWGSSLGKWGGFFQRTKWDSVAYQRQGRTFVTRLKDGSLAWGYSGKHGNDITAGITTADVQWILQYLERITDEDLSAAFAASGASTEDAARFSAAFRGRIEQLEAAAGTDTIARGQGR